jgi:hypothetical protein
MGVEEYNSGIYGISWTLKKKIAEQFVELRKMVGIECIIHEMKINKKDVVAYITARKEAEIIYIH